jgi:pimeloyl-ACP methyl ester carboxylesterase
MKPLKTLLLIAVSFAATGQAKSKTEFALSTDSVRIAYEVHSEARREGMPVLIFVHGWSCDRTYWKDQIKYFSKKLKVVTIDLAGHGESGLNRKSWTIQSYGDDVAAVVKKLDLHQIIFVGHSMGGDVIAEAALRVRDRAAGLVLVDVYKKLGAGRTGESVDAFIASLQVDFPNNMRNVVRSMFLPTSNKELVEWVVADMSSAPQEVMIAEAKAAMNYSREIAASLQKLNLPTIAINPDNEPTDQASMKQFGVDVIIMPGVGHFLMMEDPDHFNQLLMEAVQQLNQ